TIQNALKYNKKLYYSSTLEFKKISSLMNTYKAKDIIISKQYGIKNVQDPKEQAVLLGIASSIMPILLTKYSDLLVEEFNERKVTILNIEKLQDAVGIMKSNTARIITSYFQIYWFGNWHAATELNDDELDDNNIQHAASELDNNNVSKESSRLSES
ncbi:2625_t:CDS:2, partial [Racocetra persica]